MLCTFMKSKYTILFFLFLFPLMGFSQDESDSKNIAAREPISKSIDSLHNSYINLYYPLQFRLDYSGNNLVRRTAKPYILSADAINYWNYDYRNLEFGKVQSDYKYINSGYHSFHLNTKNLPGRKL